MNCEGAIFRKSVPIQPACQPPPPVTSLADRGSYSCAGEALHAVQMRRKAEALLFRKNRLNRPAHDSASARQSYINVVSNTSPTRRRWCPSVASATPRPASASGVIGGGAMLHYDKNVPFVDVGGARTHMNARSRYM